MLSRKVLENLHTVMAILAPFELFSGKVCSYFWLLTLSASPNTISFRTHSFDYACFKVCFSDAGTFFGQGGGLKMIRSYQRLGGEASQIPLFSNLHF